MAQQGFTSSPDGTDDLVTALRASPPFDALPDDLLLEVAKATHVERFTTGATILHQGGSPASALYVVRSGSVEIRDHGHLLDQPAAGEVFGELSLLSGAEPTATVTAGNDLTCFVVDGEVARQALGTAGGIAFVQSSLRRGVLQSLARESGTLAETIEDAADEQAAIAAVRRLPDLTCSLVDDGVDAVRIGHVIGSSIDELTRRLLGFAIADLGEPPAPWAWLALGSEARLEQALHTDQDHALAYDPGDRSSEEIDPYFATLAERVTAGLEAAGIPRCDGDAMAITPLLRRSLESWTGAFGDWMSDVGQEGSLMSSVVFDHRRLAGPLDVEPRFQAVLSSAPVKYPEFIRHLAYRVLDHKPPTGFIRDFVVQAKGEHAGHLDVKHGGVSIVTSLARYWAIRARVTQMSTVGRLDAVRDAGQIEEETREAIVEAFRLLWQVRLEHQVRQVRTGATPDDFVDPAHLGPIQRLGLKEAFRIIGKEQQGIAAEIGARF